MRFDVPREAELIRGVPVRRQDQVWRFTSSDLTITAVPWKSSRVRATLVYQDDGTVIKLELRGSDCLDALLDASRDV